jgi:formylglycine-generating enzyme required for sulfatase activity
MPTGTQQINEGANGYGNVSINIRVGGATMAKALAGTPFSNIAKRSVLTISASDMYTMSRTLTTTDSSIAGTVADIPAGNARTFTISVFDSLGKVQYAGTTAADVIADSTVFVNIAIIRDSIAANFDRVMKRLVMVSIPGGTFQMGDTLQSSWPYAPSEPIHEVTISSFRMSNTEVTQELYSAIMDTNPSYFKSAGSALQPVEQVSWIDAVLFCNALSKLLNKDTIYRYTGVVDSNVVIDYAKNGYRLPTEAEWEYACRAGTQTEFNWGGNLPIHQYTEEDSLNFINNIAGWISGLTEPYSYMNDIWIPTLKAPSPIASKMPNAFGLYDMHGNVAEWCNDKVAPYDSLQRVDPIGPEIPPTQTSRIRIKRGMDWFYLSDGERYYGENADFFMRSAYRSVFWADSSDKYIGFRIVYRP